MSEIVDNMLEIPGPSVRSEQDAATNEVSTCTAPEKADKVVRRPGKRGRRPAKIDSKAKLERSRQSARECRARKKLRYQYLEEMVTSREKAIYTLRDELEMVKQVAIAMDKGSLIEAEEYLKTEEHRKTKVKKKDDDDDGGTDSTTDCKISFTSTSNPSDAASVPKKPLVIDLRKKLTPRKPRFRCEDNVITYSSGSVTASKEEKDARNTALASSSTSEDISDITISPIIFDGQEFNLQELLKCAEFLGAPQSDLDSNPGLNPSSSTSRK